MNQQFEKFEKFVTNFCGAEHFPSGMDTCIAKTGMDSLGLLDLVLAIESEFDVTIDMDMIDNNTSFRDLATALFR